MLSNFAVCAPTIPSTVMLLSDCKSRTWLSVSLPNIVVAVLILIAVGVFGAIVDRDKDDDGGEPDASAQLACRHFRERCERLQRRCADVG